MTAQFPYLRRCLLSTVARQQHHATHYKKTCLMRLKVCGNYTVCDRLVSANYTITDSIVCANDATQASFTNGSAHSFP